MSFPSTIECSLQEFIQQFILYCKHKGHKTMPSILEDEWHALLYELKKTRPSLETLIGQFNWNGPAPTHPALYEMSRPICTCFCAYESPGYRRIFMPSDEQEAVAAPHLPAVPQELLEHMYALAATHNFWGPP